MGSCAENLYLVILLAVCDVCSAPLMTFGLRLEVLGSGRGIDFWLWLRSEASFGELQSLGTLMMQSLCCCT